MTPPPKPPTRGVGPPAEYAAARGSAIQAVKTGSRFLGFGTALPEHTIDGEATAELLGALWPRLRGVVTEPLTRHLVAPAERLVAPRRLGETMRLYAEHAPRLARLASSDALAAAGVSAPEIDLVISVSCTGYMVPSLDVRLAGELGFRPDITRLPLTELGCSGGAAAVAAAHRHLLAHPTDLVLVVAVEVPSLTFQRGDRSLDNLTASLVFGDGAAAAVMGTGSARSPADLSVIGSASRLLPDSAGVLGYDLRDSGFHVVLDRRLPRLIERELGAAVEQFRSRQGMGEPAFYAVHAGGPRVFDAVQRALGLDPGELAGSRQVFRQVGNVSSASILFSLAALPTAAGDGLAIAFGPGVTIELTHLRRSVDAGGNDQMMPGTNLARPRNASS